MVGRSPGLSTAREVLVACGKAFVDVAEAAVICEIMATCGIGGAELWIMVVPVKKLVTATSTMPNTCATFANIGMVLLLA